MRIIHLSDIHVWRYSYNPLRLMNKRAVGMADLLRGRAGKFRLERLEAVVERAVSLQADHILITGDLTTTALSSEFDEAREALSPLLHDPARATVLPGNHDRYTSGSVRTRQFEATFGSFAPSDRFPWLRYIDSETAILGLDPTRSHLSAKGLLPSTQLEMARDMLASQTTPPRRLIVACHYPIDAPPAHAEELHFKRMRNAPDVAAWLATLEPHLYCCGHVHAAWAFPSPSVPGQVCLNAGAPLLRDKTGLRPPGFLEIELHDRDVSVLHHAWHADAWEVRPIFQDPAFFPARRPASTSV
ncbi:metallophosphoesterase family protein [Tundrisphaera lichenicola]|uniref:metallophosphoesterase family protein n=1 Tax=Tundrisphaera lichenicola TaxID=2029860 RepID=UPI003EBB6AC6